MKQRVFLKLLYFFHAQTGIGTVKFSIDTLARGGPLTPRQEVVSRRSMTSSIVPPLFVAPAPFHGLHRK